MSHLLLALPFGVVAALTLWHAHGAPRLVAYRHALRRRKMAQAVLDQMFEERLKKERPYEGAVGLARLQEMSELVDDLTRGGRYGRR